MTCKMRGKQQEGDEEENIWTVWVQVGRRIYISLYSPYNMVAQADNTGTSKNTTNEEEKK